MLIKPIVNKEKNKTVRVINKKKDKKEVLIKPKKDFVIWKDGMTEY